jgi:type II secretory pathway component PulF
MLLRTGVPAVEALAAVRPMMANAAFDQEIESIREAVVAGQDLSARMRSSALFPPMVGYVAAVGERSGALAEALERLAGAYDLEVEVAARRLLAVLEPALILALAAVIGFIAASMMITILELSRL